MCIMVGSALAALDSANALCAEVKSIAFWLLMLDLKIRRIHISPSSVSSVGFHFR